MYDDPTTKELGVHELYEAIEFMERQFGRPFDWEAFREHLRATNKVNREELERWDIYARTDNGCLNPVLQGLSAFTSTSRAAPNILPKPRPSC